MLALPVWPVCILAGSGLADVSHWNTVLLPDPANPTMPTFMAIPPVCRSRRSAQPQAAKKYVRTPSMYNDASAPATNPSLGCSHVRRVDAVRQGADDVRALSADPAPRRLQVRIPQRR